MHDVAGPVCGSHAPGLGGGVGLGGGGDGGVGFGAGGAGAPLHAAQLVPFQEHPPVFLHTDPSVMAVHAPGHS